MNDAGEQSDFKIRFLRGTTIPEYGQLIGDWELLIGAEAVEIRGRARRTLRRSRTTTIRIPLTDILNVAQVDNRVHLAVNSAALRQRLTFTAVDPAAAEQIVRRLPTNQTEEFGRALAESKDFRDRLSSVSPVARVTPVLLGLNIVVFGAMALAEAGIVTLNPEVHVRWGSNFGPRTLDGEWWRLATSMFLHFGILHLLLNMWVLHAYGGLAERLFGSAHFLALYLLSGIGGSVTSLWWHPEVNSAGASGAIFGVFGGLLAFVVQRKNGVPASIMTAHRNSMLVFVGYNLMFGFVYPGIDNAAHLGGLLSGFLLGLGLARPVDAAYRSEHGATRLVAVTLTACALLTLAALGLQRADV